MLIQLAFLSGNHNLRSDDARTPSARPMLGHSTGSAAIVRDNGICATSSTLGQVLVLQAGQPDGKSCSSPERTTDGNFPPMFSDNLAAQGKP